MVFFIICDIFDLGKNSLSPSIASRDPAFAGAVRGIGACASERLPGQLAGRLTGEVMGAQTRGCGPRFVQQFVQLALRCTSGWLQNIAEFGVQLRCKLLIYQDVAFVK